MKTRKLESREYKVMLDHALIGNRRAAVDDLRADLQLAARRCGVKLRGEFDELKKRKIRFLDTSDDTFYHNDLVFRHRQVVNEKGHGEYTLKCRSGDRYLAACTRLKTGKGHRGERKFEEDIAPPFRSRFSHSMTVQADKKKLPASLKSAAKIYPMLGNVQCNGIVCEPSTPISTVSKLVAHERVMTGVNVELGSHDDVSLAVILWSRGWKSRIVCAELSFRYKNKQEKYDRQTASEAIAFFRAIQRLDWYLQGGTTKTRFAYGDRG